MPEANNASTNLLLEEEFHIRHDASMNEWFYPSPDQQARMAELDRRRRQDPTIATADSYAENRAKDWRPDRRLLQ